MTVRFAVLGIELFNLTLESDISSDQEVAPTHAKPVPSKFDKIRKTAAMLLIR